MAHRLLVGFLALFLTGSTVLAASPEGPCRIVHVDTGRPLILGPSGLLRLAGPEETNRATVVLVRPAGDRWVSIEEAGKGRRLHDNGLGDRLISTRYQAADDFTLFGLEADGRGAYRVRTKATKASWIVGTDGRISSGGGKLGGTPALFRFESAAAPKPKPGPPGGKPGPKGGSLELPSIAGLRLDGHDPPTYPGRPAFDLPREATIEVRLRAGWTAALEEDACILANAEGDTQRYAVYVLADGSGLLLANSEGYAGLAHDFLDGRMHHVAIVLRGGEAEFFVDGRSLGRKQVGQGSARGLPLHVGSSGGGSEPFLGELAGLRLWGTALDVKTIRTLATDPDFPAPGSTLRSKLRAEAIWDHGHRVLLLPDPDPRRKGTALEPLGRETAVTPGPSSPPIVAQDPVGGPAPGTPGPPGAPRLWPIREAGDVGRVPVRDNRFMATLRSGAIDFWLRHDPAWQTDEPWGTIVACENGADTVFEVGLRADGRGIVFSSGRWDEDYGNTVDRHDSVVFDFTDGRPHHVALVTDGDKTEVFVDGSSRGFTSRGYTVADDLTSARKDGYRSNLQLSVGAYANWTRPWQGELGGLRIWGSALAGELLHELSSRPTDSLLTAQALLVAQLVPAADGRRARLRLEEPLHAPAGSWVPAEEPKPRRVAENAEFDYTTSSPPLTWLKVVPASSQLAALGQREGAVPVEHSSAPLLVRVHVQPADASSGRSETVSATAFAPVRRNAWRSARGEELVLEGHERLRLGTDRFVRVDMPDRPRRQGAVRLDNPEMAGYHVRGVEAMLRGWDPVALEPFNFGEPGRGAKQAILEHLAYGQQQRARMIVPLGLDLTDYQSGKGRVKHQEVTSEQSLQRSLSTNLGGSLGIGPVAFSASGGFSSRAQSMQSSNSGLTVGQTVHARFHLHLDRANIQLARPFEEAVRLAASSPSLQEAERLVREFGTHYAHGIVYGGRLFEIVEVSAEEWGRVQANDMQVGLAVEGAVGPASGGFNFSHEQEFEQSFKEGVRRQQSSWESSGGTGGTNPETWTVDDGAVVPIFLDLRPLSELLTPPLFEDPAVWTSLRPLVWRAIQEHAQRTGRVPSQTSAFQPVPYSVPELAGQDGPAPVTCAATVMSHATEHRLVHVTVRLPEAESGTSVDFMPGKYHEYHFPACRQIGWNNLKFECRDDGQWHELYSGLVGDFKTWGSVGCESSSQMEIVQFKDVTSVDHATGQMRTVRAELRAGGGAGP